ncbi:MAG: metal ABC transporter substrate-binding protein [Phormidesmis priestleyi]|uniref:Metal ABC transporter substrate-binding protein n=1 Tax=Phormidesmis priestleyi TaxID=268141 RepID=A0A2W4YYL1_9CYAN|nr:MAG: metal ABC transporter substrate-binding protein [Phormidesmis priestleyi]
MRKPLRLLSKLTALSFALTVVSCAQTEGNQAQDPGSQPQAEAPSEGKPQVVASYSVLCDLTEQIAQTTVDLTCLIGAGRDPHVYSATPADRRSIEEADLVLYGGYEFEPEIIKMVEATDTAVPKVAVSEVAVPEPLLGEHHDEEHVEGEEHAEGEMEPDPHVWHDAENGVAMVKEIQRQLSEVSPNNAALYETNAEALIAQLEQLDTWIQSQVDTVPASGRTLISTHDALGYYANAYGLEIEAALDSFSTEARPSAESIKGLAAVVEEKGVSSIFVESTSNPGLIETVSRETDIAVSEDPIYADGLGDAETPAASYQGMLMSNTCTIVTGLGGTCDQAAAQALLPNQ